MSNTYLGDGSDERQQMLAALELARVSLAATDPDSPVTLANLDALLATQLAEGATTASTFGGLLGLIDYLASWLGRDLGDGRTARQVLDLVQIEQR